MNLIVVSQPPEEPVSLDDVYDHLRLTPTDSPPTHPHDDMLRRHIKTSRGEAESITKRAFVEQTIRLYANRFPCSDAFIGGERWGSLGSSFSRSGWIELLRPPLIAVQSVRYYDENNALQTVDTDDYFVTDDLVPRLCFVEGYSSPQVYARADALRVDYVVGYQPEGSPAEDYTANIPSEIKDAILIGVELLYNALKPDERESRERARDALLFGHTIHSL